MKNKTIEDYPLSSEYKNPKTASKTGTIPDNSYLYDKIRVSGAYKGNISIPYNVEDEKLKIRNRIANLGKPIIKTSCS